MEKITQYLIQSTVHGSEVRAWEEDIMLPTYEIGEEEKNPIFLEKRRSEEHTSELQSHA